MYCVSSGMASPRCEGLLSLPRELLETVWARLPTLERLALRASSSAAAHALPVVPRADVDETRFFKAVEALEACAPGAMLDVGRDVKDSAPFRVDSSTLNTLLDGWRPCRKAHVHMHLESAGPFQVSCIVCAPLGQPVDSLRMAPYTVIRIINDHSRFILSAWRPRGAADGRWTIEVGAFEEEALSVLDRWRSTYPRVFGTGPMMVHIARFQARGLVGSRRGPVAEDMCALTEWCDRGLLHSVWVGDEQWYPFPDAD